MVECRRLGLPSAKSAIAFRNLSYRPKLGVNPNAPLRFVGNFPWPEGRETWEASEQLRLHRPPFPKLIKQHLTEGDGRIISWDGIVRLRSWTGFASDADLSSSGWVPTRGRRPEGDLRLVVDPSKQSPFEPTEVQARTFQSLLDQEATYLEHVLQGIFDVYPSWRENYFGERVSSDGGKTWKTGWELPEQYPPQEMPELSHPSELRRLIQPATVYVLANEEDGFTRVGFGFSCKWDEEHGLGVSTHRGAVLEVGGEEVAFEDH
ncbi:MAG TPA: hypothetical protein DCE44_23910 [Verrucomicrobiales bacterium]|nr:hypothetical protein [Verrucomicrobiales bacterium]